MTDQAGIKNPPRQEQELSCEVLVLAGGQGLRLRQGEEAASDLTKILQNVGGNSRYRPMIEIALNQIGRLNPPEVVLLTGKDPLADGQGVENFATEWLKGTGFNGKLSSVREKQPLGTAGAVANALMVRQSESATSVVAPSDTLFPFMKLPGLVAFHEQNEADITWAITSEPGENAQNMGRILVNSSTQLIEASFEASPDVDVEEARNESQLRRTSVGVLIVNNSFFRRQFAALFASDDQKPVDLYREFLPQLFSQNRIIGYDIKEPAQDLGTPERFEKFGIGALDHLSVAGE